MMGLIVLMCCYLLIREQGTGVEAVKEPSGKNAQFELGMEPVFFRQKATVHTTRSRWIIGLVLDLTTYERYLVFTNKTLTEARVRADKGLVYFQRLSASREARRNVLNRQHNFYVESNEEMNAAMHKYYALLIQQQQELQLLQGIHDKNWQDFQELRLVGHSELEMNRMSEPVTTRPKRFVGAILGGLAGIASVFSIFSTYQLKSEVAELRENQLVLKSVLRDNLLMVNLTRMEVQENRVKINQIIDGLGQLSRHFYDNVVPLRRFVITSAQMQTNLGKLRDLVSAESDLLNELFRKVDKLATRRLSSTLLPAPELVRILKGVELELPNSLMLPQDPRERPFFYYTALTTSTIALEDVLLIGIEVPLLDVSRKLKVMEAIALPVPYTGTDLTAQYTLEFSNFAISEDGRQYVVLTLEDQLNCAKKEVSYCSLTSAIRETNRHSYCTLALYQRDEKKVRSLCGVKVSNKIKLPTAHYVSRGEWLVATGEHFNLRKYCVNQLESEIVPVKPPYAVVTLESGCSALADVIELPIYFEERREYHVNREDRIVKLPENFKMSELTVWRELTGHRKDLMSHIKKLGDIEEQPIQELLDKLETIREDSLPGLFPDNRVLYTLVILIIVVVSAVMMIYCCRRMKRRKAKLRERGRARSQVTFEAPSEDRPEVARIMMTSEVNRGHRKRMRPRAPGVPLKLANVQEEEEY